MSTIGSESELQDETALHWNWLEEERDACVVVSERMELVFANAAARELVPGQWFGKRCFEVLPVVDETCAFHCSKITAVTSSTDVVYCEETVCTYGKDCEVFGVGLIPLGTGRADRGRAVLFMRNKRDDEPEADFEARLLRDARGVRDRIVARSA